MNKISALDGIWEIWGNNLISMKLVFGFNFLITTLLWEEMLRVLEYYKIVLKYQLPE